MRKILITLAIIFSFNANAQIIGGDKEILLDKLDKIGFSDKHEINRLLNEATILPKIIRSQNHAAEKRLSINSYISLFNTDKKIKIARDWINKNKISLERAELKYGVDKEIIAAILLIETKFNSVKGRYRVIDAIVTRVVRNPSLSSYFTKQIPAWIEICNNQGFSLGEKKRSYAGAMGMPQFMPTSFIDFAVDGDGDGKINIWSNTSDVIFSVANYFHKHHWMMGQRNLWSKSKSKKLYKISVQDEYIYIKPNIKVIQKYNSSILYAMAAASIYDRLINRH